MAKKKKKKSSMNKSGRKNKKNVKMVKSELAPLNSPARQNFIDSTKTWSEKYDMPEYDYD